VIVSLLPPYMPAFRRRNASGGPVGRIVSFPNGIEELPRAIAASLGDSLRTHSPVVRLRRIPSGWTVYSGPGEISPPHEFRAVICALPPDALAALTLEGVPRAERLALMKEIEQPPVASVFTGYRREDVAHPLDGFGVLAPRVEKRQILGTLFSSTLFPGRAPSGHVALTTFAGGALQPEVAGLDDRELLNRVRSELGHLLGVRNDPVFVSIRRWPRAIPQYNLGFEHFLDGYAAVEANAPGLFIGGNCRDGISLAYCMASGRRLADAVLGYGLKRPP